MNLSLKRRIIYTALSDFISEQHITDAMNIWEKSYTDKSRYEINNFLAECSASVPGVKENKPAIYRKIVGLMMSPESVSLKAYYIDDNASAVHSPSDDTSYTDGKIYGHLLTIIVRKMLSSIYPETRNSVIYYLHSNHRMSLSMLRESLDSSDSPVSMLSLKEAKKSLNTVYICLCEYIGPVEADRILSSVIDYMKNTYHNDRSVETQIKEIFNK